MLTVRRRNRISHDPNNTNWSRSESKYGQRILRSQGWNPGDFLGAKGAPHAKHYTEANASHIKVALREDNLGLGARRGAAGGEWQTTGLNGFQDLLGRLNGKSEKEIEKSQKSREDVQRKIYTERRWGGLHFVSGGFLVGDQIDEAIDQPAADKARSDERGSSSNAIPKQEAVVEDDTVDATEEKSVFQRPSKNERRAAKAERKLLKQLRREARAAKLEAEKAPSSQDPSKANSEIPMREREMPQESDFSPIEETKPAKPDTTPLRHVARQRNIRHKKMAMMDSKALNEVLIPPAICATHRLTDSTDPDDQGMRYAICMLICTFESSAARQTSSMTWSEGSLGQKLAEA